jgi:hypothetical protein
MQQAAGTATAGARGEWCACVTPLQARATTRHAPIRVPLCLPSQILPGITLRMAAPPCCACGYTVEALAARVQRDYNDALDEPGGSEVNYDASRGVQARGLMNLRFLAAVVFSLQASTLSFVCCVRLLCG